MKTTAQRLAEVYCRPTTEDEWKQLSTLRTIGYRTCHQKDEVAYFIHNDKGYVAHFIPEDHTEIPVQHFQDLLNDSIVGWRLIEDGFIKDDVFIEGYYTYARPANEEKDTPRKWFIHILFQHDGDIRILLDGEPIPKVKTYTKLLTLIELIG